MEHQFALHPAYPYSNRNRTRTLKTFTENRFEFGDGENKTNKLKYAYIQLGGLRIGKDESAFHTFSGYLGDVINDDVVTAGAYDTNLISYTSNAGNGFSAVLSAEQGGERSYLGEIEDKDGVFWDVYLPNKINDYMPHVVGGVKFEQAWGAIAAVAAYDSLLEEWAGKVKVDLNVTDTFSV